MFVMVHFLPIRWLSPVPWGMSTIVNVVVAGPSDVMSGNVALTGIGSSLRTVS